MGRLIMGRKTGQIGIQFNWIFIIIAGALILSFFVMIVTRQRDLAEKKLAADLLADLDMIITGQAVSPGSSKLLDMAELELSFSCEDYSIKEVPRTSGNAILFSPSKIKGSKIIAWTLEWDMPYRTANFIYITVPEIKYYFIDPTGTGIGNEIKSEFPETIDIEVLGSDTELPPEFEESQRIRIVYFRGPPLSTLVDLPNAGLDKFKDEQVSVLYLDLLENMDASDFNGKTEMHFWKKKGDTSIIRQSDPVNPFPAIKKETLYGAIFTDDYELYVCNMGKALKKLEVVTEIYKGRVKSIVDNLDSDDPCIPYYAEDDLQGMINSIVPAPGDPIEVGNLFGYMGYVEATNDQTIFASCPEIY